MFPMTQIRWFYGLSAERRAFYFYIFNMSVFFIFYAIPDEYFMGKEIADRLTAQYCPTVWHHLSLIAGVALTSLLTSLFLYCVWKYRESKA